MEAQKETSTPNPPESKISAMNNEQVDIKPRKRIVKNVVLAVALGIAVLFFVTGAFANTGYIWIFVFLTSVFFLSGKDVTRWLLLSVVALLTSVWFHSLGLLALPYSYSVIFNFFLSLLVFIGSLLFFHYKKERQEKLLKSKEEVFKSEKAVERSLQDRALELERVKVAMANMTKDVLAERDRVEKERAKDAAILQSVGDGLFAADLDGNVILVNLAAEELLELKEEEILGRPLYKVFVLYDEEGKIVPEEERPIYIALETGGEINKIFVYKGKDKRKIFLNIIATPIRQRDKVIGAIGVVRDVTKEKEVDRMKTEFISLASHQLRTPLSAIKWFTEMLIAGDAGALNPEQNDFAKNIIDSTERMIELVNSLLNISRIESGRIIISPEPTDLKKLVESIATELRVKFEQKRQVFVLSVHDSLPQITIDPQLIRQVYLNLLTNAIKYSPEGGEITVFISRNNEEIISQVSDNGYGIPKEQQGKVFKKFFRAENVAKMETDGTGLGLYLIKAIVESSKGKIWFQSEAGKGTSFWFSLPVAGVTPKKGEVTLDSPAG